MAAAIAVFYHFAARAKLNLQLVSYQASVL